MELNRRSASALSVNRHFVRVPAKRRDVRLDPAEGHALVLEARVEIAERGIVRELGSRKETD